jgi:glucose/arabinose dehydrogenase
VPWQPRFEQPVVFWVPSIAVSGIAFYTGTKLPKWATSSPAQCSVDERDQAPSDASAIGSVAGR